jgi:hypothetical protein
VVNRWKPVAILHLEESSNVGWECTFPRPVPSEISIAGLDWNSNANDLCSNSCVTMVESTNSRQHDDISSLYWLYGPRIRWILRQR